jgi:hypothetical protein
MAALATVSSKLPDCEFEHDVIGTDGKEKQEKLALTWHL